MARLRTGLLALAWLSLAAWGLLAMALLTASVWLQTDNPPQPADILVVLGGDPARADYAATLHQQALAPLVYVSRSFPEAYLEHFRWAGATIPAEEEATSRLLLARGVPAAAIQVYGQGVLSTVEEAEALAATLSTPPARILCVTTPSHTRRVELVFRRIFPHSQVQAVGDPSQRLATAWWRDQWQARQVVLETAKLVHYLLGGRTGAFRAQP